MEYNELSECDLVMKGGVTSGVVYPFALKALAENYRLRSIGGSSAGAIAAAIAGAAEYRRFKEMKPTGGQNATAGFDGATKRIEELQDGVGPLFQPTGGLTAPFNVFRNIVDAGDHWVLAVAKAYWGIFVLSALLAVTVGVANGFGSAIGVASAILTFFALVTGSAIFILGLSASRLRNNGFGACTGLTQPGNDHPALTDWLAEGIDMIAHGEKEKVTTVGDLKEACVTVEVMTTNVTEGRPYRLPFWDDRFFFRKSQFEEVFPKYVIDYMCRPEHGGPEEPDFYPMPIGKKMPVVVLARMSLSFPVLFSMIPLWRKSKASGGAWEQHYFSDGGLSSNFPVHFFDAPMPVRPTFGIRFADFNHGDPDTHVRLASDMGQARSVTKIAKIGTFIKALFFTSKDWKDNLQTDLPGYPNRIAELLLEENQGGLNLWMSPSTLKEMYVYGTRAGELLTRTWHPNTSVQFREHQLHRSELFAAATEHVLDQVKQAFDDGYKEALMDPAVTTTLDSDIRESVLLPFMEQVVQMVPAEPLATGRINQAMPEGVSAEMRLTATEGAPILGPVSGALPAPPDTRQGYRIC